MPLLFYVFFSAGIVALDQFTKYLTVANIPLHTNVPLLPGIVRLTYVQNTGAAFSMFRGMQWLFVLVFLALTVLLLWEYYRSPMPFTRLERFCLAAVYGGGLGNMLDRIRLGYVVDMIETEFIVFPVFNVADCFICCGCILLMVHMIFFNPDFWKEGKHGTHR